MDSNNIYENEVNAKQKLSIKKGPVITFALIIILIFMALSNLYVLKPNEYAVVRQFGEIVKVEDKEGLKFKLPFLQSKYILPKSVLLYDVPPSEINTLDKKRIVVDYYALWVITDPIDMIESLRTLEGAELRLSNIIYSNVRNELGKLEYGGIINSEDNDRGGVDKLVQDQINDILTTNKNGIQVVDMKMKRIDLPLSNEESVYKRMISERESKAQEYLSQGDAEARKITAQVDREVEEIIAKAKSEAELIVAKGEGEAAKTYNDIYGKDGEFFKLYTTLESYKKTINGETVILMPIGSPYLKYILGQ
ncbi:MAG TPA: protease modulator HflC [Epulopiscium sp.]|nr:protease modulator HflC [Candidatus Epulonipiscium sp.]